MAETKTEVKTLGYMVDGEWRESQSDTWVDITDSNTGEVIARTPMCTEAEVTEAIESANRAFALGEHAHPEAHRGAVHVAPDAPRAAWTRSPRWSRTELGKNLDEARGEVIKIIEAIDIAVGAPMAMKGECLMNVSTGHDTVSYREPLGVFAGIAPFNFPAMIPFGWMLPMCIAMRQHLRAQGRQPRAAHEPPAARHALRGRPAQGRRQHGHGREGRGRGPAQAPGRPRRQLRRHHAGRQARLLASPPRTASASRRRPRPRTTASCSPTPRSSAPPAASSTPPSAAPACAAWRCPSASSRTASPTSSSAT